MIIKYFFGMLLLLFTVFSLALCGDWNEGSMQGSCAISVMEPLYNQFMGLLLLAAFMSFIWLPILILIQLLVSKYSKKTTSSELILFTTLDKNILRDPKKYWWLYLILLNFGLSYLRDFYF